MDYFPREKPICETKDVSYLLLCNNITTNIVTLRNIHIYYLTVLMGQES